MVLGSTDGYSIVQFDDGNSKAKAVSAKCSLVIIVRVIFMSSFLFYCLLLNHSFSTNPNKMTNCFQTYSLSICKLYKLHFVEMRSSIFEFLKNRHCQWNPRRWINTCRSNQYWHYTYSNNHQNNNQKSCSTTSIYKYDDYKTISKRQSIGWHTD